MKLTRPSLTRFSLLLTLCLIALVFPMAALAQAADEDVQGPVVVGTVVDAEATAPVVPPVDQPDTPAPPESTDIEKAIANFINALPAMFGFALLVALIGYLIRERTELIRLMSNVMSEDMATSVFDTLVKGILSVAGGVNRIIPGNMDDEYIDGLGKQAGLMREKLPDGKYGPWKPIPGFTFETAPTQLSPFAGMQRVALADGTYAYKPGSASNQQRTFNPDGSYTLAPVPGQSDVSAARDAGNPAGQPVATAMQDVVTSSGGGAHTHSLLATSGPGNPYEVPVPGG